MTRETEIGGIWFSQVSLLKKKAMLLGRKKFPLVFTRNGKLIWKCYKYIRSYIYMYYIIRIQLVSWLHWKHARHYKNWLDYCSRNMAAIEFRCRFSSALCGLFETVGEMTWWIWTLKIIHRRTYLHLDNWSNITFLQTTSAILLFSEFVLSADDILRTSSGSRVHIL